MTNKPRPYILAETNWKTVESTDYEIAILPWGATEAHNYHMPYATDIYEAEAAASESARKAWEAGAKIIVLPCIPFGVNTGQLDIKLCMNMRPTTQYAILKDVVDVLLRHKIKKLVILNAHGGNQFKTMIRELSIDFEDMFVCSIDWWKCLDAQQYFDEPGDHAGEMETSLIMALKPHLLLPLEEAGPGTAKSYALRGLREGWVSGQRHWTQVSSDTGVGNPQMATQEKGQKFLEDASSKIATFLIELAQVKKIEDLYE